MNHGLKALVGAGGALALVPLVIWQFRHLIETTPTRPHLFGLVAATELAGAAVATWPTALLAPGLLVVALAVPAVVIDAAEHRIPDRLSLPLATGVAVALVATIATGHPVLIVTRSLIAGAAWTALLLVSFLVFGQPGPGDVKLAPSLGMMLGWFGWSWLIAGIAMTYLAAATIGLFAVLTGRLPLRGSTIPLGPMMVAATLIVTTTAALTQA